MIHWILYMMISTGVVEVNGYSRWMWMHEDAPEITAEFCPALEDYDIAGIESADSYEITTEELCDL